MKIMLVTLLTVGCGTSFPTEPIPDTDQGDATDMQSSDVGIDIQPDQTTEPSLRFFTFDRPDYNPIPVTDGENFELTSGFQGGWMLELAVVREVSTPNRLNGTYHWTVMDGSTVLLDTSQPAVGDAWYEEDGGSALRLFQEQLNIITKDEVVGRELDLEVIVDHADGTESQGTLRVTIVDEFEELL